MIDRILATGLATIAISTATAPAAFYSENFENVASNATTFTGFTSSGTGTGRVLKVQDTSTNRNGNKSFLFADTENANGSSPAGVITFGSETSVTLQFDVWIGVAPPTGGDIQFSLRGTRTSDSAEAEAARIYFTTTDIFARQGNGVGANNTNNTLQSGYAMDTRYRFIVNANALTDTYTVQMNGGTLYSGRFVNNVLLNDLSKFQFTAGGANAGVRVETFYIDDISVVPEPASVALLSGVGILLARRRR